jgi:hypothetical protein
VSSSHWQSARRLVTAGCDACGKVEKKGRGIRGGSGLALHVVKERIGGWGPAGQAATRLEATGAHGGQEVGVARMRHGTGEREG